MLLLECIVLSYIFSFRRLEYAHLNNKQGNLVRMKCLFSCSHFNDVLHNLHNFKDIPDLNFFVDSCTSNYCSSERGFTFFFFCCSKVLVFKA